MDVTSLQRRDFLRLLGLGAAGLSLPSMGPLACRGEGGTEAGAGPSTRCLICATKDLESPSTRAVDRHTKRWFFRASSVLNFAIPDIHTSYQTAKKGTFPI